MCRKKTVSLLSFAGLVFVLGGFLWMGVLNALNGPSSGDDAWIAMAAKNVAVGKGYATSISSEERVLFDPLISTGPTLVLPAALLIYFFGQGDWVPGAAQLLVFAVQMIAFIMLSARFFGWQKTLPLVALLMLTLMLISSRQWYFGALLGEPVALGFLLLAAILLAAGRGQLEMSVAGVFFALAVLTKLISIFAIAGMIMAWLLGGIVNRLGAGLMLKNLGFTFVFGVGLIVAAELAKLVVLGVTEYEVLIKNTWLAVKLSTIDSTLTAADASLLGRLVNASEVLDKSYFSIFIMAALSIVPLVLVPWLLHFERQNIVYWFALICFFGSVVHLGYVFFLAPYWPRYFWVGVALFVVSAMVPLVETNRLVGSLLIAALLSGILMLGLHQPLLKMYSYIDSSRVPEERSQVVHILNTYSKMPYVAQSWSSIYDIVYSRDAEGQWAYGNGIENFRNESFIGIINSSFTNKDSKFYKEVTSTCELLTHDSTHIRAYFCTPRFWSEFK